MYTASIATSPVPINIDVQKYHAKLRAERDLYEAIDLLNSLMTGIRRAKKFRMVDENEVELVDIETNERIRLMHRDEVFAISGSLQKLLDYQTH